MLTHYTFRNNRANSFKDKSVLLSEERVFYCKFQHLYMKLVTMQVHQHFILTMTRLLYDLAQIQVYQDLVFSWHMY